MKINVLALSRLMETDVATLPGAVQSAWSYALPVVIRMFTEIRVIQEKKTEVLQELSRMDDEAEQDTTAEERDVPDDYGESPHTHTHKHKRSFLIFLSICVYVCVVAEDLSDEEVYQDQNHKDYIEFLASKVLRTIRIRTHTNISSIHLSHLSFCSVDSLCCSPR